MAFRPKISKMEFIDDMTAGRLYLSLALEEFTDGKLNRGFPGAIDKRYRKINILSLSPPAMSYTSDSNRWSLDVFKLSLFLCLTIVFWFFMLIRIPSTKKSYNLVVCVTLVSFLFIPVLLVNKTGNNIFNVSYINPNNLLTTCHLLFLPLYSQKLQCIIQPVRNELISFCNPSS